MPNDLPDWQRLVAAPLNLGSVTTAAGATASADINAPFGHLGIGFEVNLSGGNANPTQVTVLGNQDLLTYLNPANPTGGGPHAAMAGALNTSYHLTVTAPIGVPSSVVLVGWMSQPVVGLNPNIEAPVPVTFFSSSNALLVAQPAPWQAPKNLITFSASVAAAATGTVLAAQGGVQFFLHSYSVSNDGANAAGNFSFVDTNGGFLEIWYANATRQVYATGDFRGVPLSAGAGVNIRNDGAAASFLAGSLRYNQK